MNQLNSKIAEADYNYRHKLESLSDRIETEFQVHLKAGDFNFNSEKFEVIDLGGKIVGLLDSGPWEIFGTIHPALTHPRNTGGRFGDFGDQRETIQYRGSAEDG